MNFIVAKRHCEGCFSMLYGRITVHQQTQNLNYCKELLQRINLVRLGKPVPNFITCQRCCGYTASYSKDVEPYGEPKNSMKRMIR